MALQRRQHAVSWPAWVGGQHDNAVRMLFVRRVCEKWTSYPNRVVVGTVATVLLLGVGWSLKSFRARGDPDTLPLVGKARGRGKDKGKGERFRKD